MAVYTQLPEIKKQMERSKARFWWVSDSDGTTISEQEDGSKTVEDSFTELEEFIEAQEGDFVFITVRAKLPNRDKFGNYKQGGDNAGPKFEYRVKVKPEPGKAPGINGHAVNGLADIYGQIGDLKAQLVRSEMQAKLDLMQRSLDELKSGSSGKGSKTEMIADKLIDRFAREWFKKDGEKIADETELTYERKEQPKAPEETTEQRQQVIKESIGAISGVMGADTYKLLETLKKMAKDNPDGFKEQAKFLMDSNDTK